MAVDGTYQIEINSPMGKMESKLTFKTRGNVLTGKAESQMGTNDFTGQVNGNEFSWESEIESPMGKMQLTYKGKVAGSDISGEVIAGNFGSSPFKGKKI